MKPKYMLGVLFLVLVSAAFALSSNDRKLINECKKDCRTDLTPGLESCNTIYSECIDQCSTQIAQCKLEQQSSLNTCSENCSLLFTGLDLNKCNSQCQNAFNVRKLCNINICRKTCYDNKRSCTNKANDKYKNCRNNCIYTAFNKNITCGTYKAGDIFLQGCDICECKYSSLIECKKSLTCNFEDFTVSKEICEKSGGLYQQVCKGPYFRLRCGKDFYCQCGGTYNYQCPEEYICLYDFKISNIPPTIPGYNNMLGLPIGDVGICAKKPVLENCGNGICENIICEECPAAETNVTCPQDC